MQKISRGVNILGVSAFRQDSAASLLRDAEIIAAAQEERFSRSKHDAHFPAQAIEYCLGEAGICAAGLDLVAFYNDGVKDKLKASYSFRKIKYRRKIIFFSLKESYLASAFYPSYFKEAAILVNHALAPGVLFGKGRDNRVEEIKCLKDYAFPAALYSAVTAYLGFQPYSEEYKVMGLAAFGQPKYRDLLLNNADKISAHSLKDLFGRKAYGNGAEITQEQMDIAASVQSAAQTQTLKLVEALYKINASENLCICGSMGLNCILNTEILKQGLFKHLWIQPAATDAGCAIGAAYLAWHKYLGQQRPSKDSKDKLKNAFLGPSYSDADIEEFLIKNNIPYQELDYAKIPALAAELLAGGNVIGWFQGRMEFGPRALGARSILADSRSFAFHDRLNLKVKFRENFRPFAPTVLAEKAQEYFDLAVASPYMLFVAQTRQDKKKEIPAVVHIDDSSRIQTLARDTHPLYYDTVNAFYQKTGCPVLINTSFNTKNEPIVATLQDTYACFKKTDIDYLIMNKFLLAKSRR